MFYVECVNLQSVFFQHHRGYSCLVCLQNTNFKNILVADQNQMQKYEKQEEDKEKEMHLSSSELCLCGISVFAGKL